MKILSIILIFIVALSCASEKPEGKTKAEVLFKEAKELMEDERFILATDKLNQLRNQYPYSYYATPAELMLADILYKQESYGDAMAAYIVFRDLHPKHEKIPYVVFKIAESYYNQLPDTFDRDLEMGVEAIKYYNELLLKYPDSIYVKDAKSKIERCKDMIRKKEKYIADFYFKTESFKAAKWRYLDILDNFSDPKLRSYATRRAIETSYELKQYDFCSQFAEKNKGDLVVQEDQKEALAIAGKCTRKVKRTKA